MATWKTQAYKYTGSAALKGGEVMKFSAFGQVDVATAITDKVVGVAAHAAVQNDNLGLYLPGQIVEMQASAAITAGAYVMPTTGGQIVTATAKNATGNSTVSYYLGFATEAAANANEKIAVFFWPSEVNV